MRSKRKVKRIWKSHFEHLMNEKTKGNNSAEYGCGKKMDNVCLCRKEVKIAMDTLKCGRAAGVDRITAEIFKYGETLVERMFMICDLAWRQKSTI